MDSAGTFYGPDLAAIHARHYEALAHAAAEVLLPLLSPGSRVLDLGCGAGPLSHLLAAQGHEVSGIELSAALLSVARQRVPEGRFMSGNILTANLGKTDAVAAIGEVLNYAMADAEPEALRAFLLRVRISLPAEGLFLFDVAGPDRHGDGEYVWAERPDSFVAMHASRQSDIVTRKITIFVGDGDTWKKSNEVHRLRTFAPDEVVKALQDAGFHAQELSGYGDCKFPIGLHAFLATVQS